MRIQKSINEPKRSTTDYDTLWNGPDKGLIASWECGRDKAKKDPELAAKAKNGELVILGWKGGVGKPLKIKTKYGSLLYMAMWRGLRGEDLDIDSDQDFKMICVRTGVTVTYTSNITLLNQSTDDEDSGS